MALCLAAYGTLVDEDAYKLAREELNPLACAFEKALLSRCCNCELASRKNIAEREMVACSSAVSRQNCQTLRELLHANARFTLKLTQGGPLPHAKELKVQCGGLIGLQRLVGVQTVQNVHGLVLVAQEKFMGLENFPYSEIIQSVSAYEARPKR